MTTSPFFPSLDLILSQLNAVRDSALVERVLIANTRTEVREVNVAEFEDKHTLSQELVRLIKENKPVVVRKAGADWKVVRRWGNPDTLIAQAQKEEIEYPHRKYTAYKPEADGHLNQSHAAPFGFMTFHKYLQTGRKNHLYMLGVPDKAGRGASPFEARKGETTPPIFAEDIDSDDGPKIFSDLFRGSLATRRHVFFNSAYSFTNLHYDTDWNTYLCVLGKRCWTIAHPDQSPLIGAANGGASYSLLRPTKGIEGFKNHRLAHLIKFCRVELYPGDVLLVPPTWWHVVEGLTDGFSCGINWFHTFSRIDSRSPVDRGWEWTHRRGKKLIMKSSMMSSVMEARSTSSSSSDEEVDIEQPEGSGDGLQFCSNSDFVSKIKLEIEGIYGRIPSSLNKILESLHDESNDFILSRQLVRIAVNSLKREPSPTIDQFNRLSEAIAGITAFRASVMDGKKRKRGSN